MSVAAAAPGDILLTKGTVVQTTCTVTLGEETVTYILGPWTLECDMTKSEVDEAIDARYLDPKEMSTDQVQRLLWLIGLLRGLRQWENTPLSMPVARQVREADIALQQRIVRFLRRQPS